MPRNPDADPVFEAVMKAIRTGKNPDHIRIEKLDAKKQKAVREALKKRAGKHSYKFQNGDVTDTGMFDS